MTAIREAGPSNRPHYHTSTELAQCIARIELGGTQTLSRHTWRTAGAIYCQVVERLPPRRAKDSTGRTFDRLEFETALEVMAIRRLVSLEREEYEITLARPQRYRWSRYATVEALERFSRDSVQCGRAGCTNLAVGRSPYCSHVCRDASRKGRVKK